MFDLNLIREQPDLVRAALRNRNGDPALVDEALALDAERRALLGQVEALKAERNAASKEISRMKDATERQARIEQMRLVSDQIAELDNRVRDVEEALKARVSMIPNLPLPDVPVGPDEHENVVLRTEGTPRTFDFTPLPHWDLGPALGILNFEQGVKITGSRFYVLKGAGARLQRALIAWMLDLHARQGYHEQYLPFMVKEATMFASGQLPKFYDNLYHDVEEDYWMVPTAEVPLTGIHIDDILDEADLPLRYTAYTPCFRREKMSAGRDVRGAHHRRARSAARVRPSRRHARGDRTKHADRPAPPHCGGNHRLRTWLACAPAGRPQNGVRMTWIRRFAHVPAGRP
jgi:seryl-tRNA synthetase